MKNSSDTIGNRTHDLMTCSAVPQTTAPPRTPFFLYNVFNLCVIIYKDKFIDITFHSLPTVSNSLQFSNSILNLKTVEEYLQSALSFKTILNANRTRRLYTISTEAFSNIF